MAVQQLVELSTAVKEALVQGLCGCRAGGLSYMKSAQQRCAVYASGRTRRGVDPILILEPRRPGDENWLSRALGRRGDSASPCFAGVLTVDETCGWDRTARAA